MGIPSQTAPEAGAAAKWSAWVLAQGRRLFTGGELEDLTYWRLSMLGWIRGFMLVALPFAMAVSIRNFALAGQYGLIAVDVAGYVGVLAMVVMRRNYHVQSIIFIALLWTWTFVFFLTLGPGYARSAWLMVSALGTAMLYGVRGGLTTVPLSLGLLVLSRWLADPTNEGWASTFEGPPSQWTVFIINVLTLQLAIALGTGYLLDTLDRALRRSKENESRLREQHEKLASTIHRLHTEQAQNEALNSRLRHSEKLESLGQLASGIAHDLNNMLMPISSFTEMVRDDLPREDPAREDLDDVLAAAMRARELTMQILAFGRQIGPTDEVVDVAGVVARTVREIAMHAPPDVRVLCADLEEDAAILGNESALHRVVMNLVTNAVHATQSRQGQVRVAVDVEGVEPPADLAKSELGYVCISVSDEGIGMPPEVMHRIFDPFFTTKRMGKGTGLGLATVHGIVNALGGTLRVDSEVGVGTTFWVYLPRVAGTQRAISDGVAAVDLDARVLLIDDDGPSRRAAARMLERLGATVTALGSARAASARIDRGDFDLIVTDHDMPGMTGSELIARLRRRGDETPIILVSGLANADLRQRVAESANTVFLPKPFTRQDLLAAVGTLDLETLNTRGDASKPPESGPVLGSSQRAG